MHVLLVEDDDTVADAIVRAMSLSGFDAHRVNNANDAYNALFAHHFSVAIVDIGLPGADGMSFVRRIRKEGSKVPILTLTARHSLNEKLNAFELGVDDYVLKPFDLDELLARCRALVRRTNASSDGLTRYGRVNVKFADHTMTVDGNTIDLTKNEWLIFELLARNIGHIVNKDRLLAALSGADHESSPNAVETHVSRLRTKLRDALHIRTVRGLGYRLEED
ncbi:MAG TPA: response regulator transcription factor [Steroidobacteraceae bacterium]|nr:response regulator transcription factor [Steroidobacteraceae bacterium]